MKTSNNHMKWHMKWALVAAAALVLSLAPRAIGDDLYAQTNLVSNVPGMAAVTDPNLVNPWGISNSATSPYWISDQGTGVSTLYNGVGTPNSLVVTIPPTASGPQGPTGTVNNSAGAGNFVLPDGAASSFLFATLGGTIDGWNGGAGTTAVQTAATAGASFTGLALANNGSGNFLYAANFVAGGGINVFNSAFAATNLAGGFVDPNLPAGYAPFNIQLIGGNLYVTYAQVSSPGVAGHTLGDGVVAVFDTNGNFLQQLISPGVASGLDSPWGIALAPATFGAFGGDLLVGNFGNGEINAFSDTTGAFLGTIDDSTGAPLVNQDLWALEFANGSTTSVPGALYFTAGIDRQAGGLFGYILPTPEPSSLLLLATGLFGMVGVMMWRRNSRGRVATL